MNIDLKKIILFFIIIAIAIAFRFYRLGDVPPSPDWDEAALGYNAYSILKTGRDEYGNFLPLSIRSFDDYKPPLYTYLTVPSVGLFGLNTWSTRLPSAIMGVLAVVGVYFLVKELINNYELRMTNDELKKKNHALSVIRNQLMSQWLPFLSSFLLAISPWHIQFSRIAFEANIGITMNIWAVTLFLLGLRKRMLLPLSAFLFGLGMYAYHSERVFIPFLVCLLFFLYRNDLFSKKMIGAFGIACVVGCLTVLPLLTVFFDKSAMLRLRGTSSFTEQTELLGRTIAKLEDDQKRNDTFGMLLDNRRLVYAKTIASGYLSHFSLKWLFLNGDNPRHHAPGVGLLYLWELPFLFLGIYALFKKSWDYPGTKLLIGWFLIAPVAASITTGVPHAIRTLVFLPTFQIFTAVGILTVVKMIQDQQSTIKRMSFLCLMFIVFCLMVWNSVYYISQYFIMMNKEYSEYWQYGYKEAVAYTESVKDQYEKIVVSTGLEQSYMFFLFYTKFDPTIYLQRGGTKSGSFAEYRNAFDRYIFRPLDWRNEQFDGKTLYVGAPSEMPHGNNAHITFLDGKPAIEIKDRMD